MKPLTEGSMKGPVKRTKKNSQKPIGPPHSPMVKGSSFDEIAEHLKPKLDQMACEIQMEIFKKYGK